MHKAAARQDHARATEDDDEAGLTRAASEPCQAICIHARENRPVIRSVHTAARAPKAWQPAAGLESRSRERASGRARASSSACRCEPRQQPPSSSRQQRRERGEVAVGEITRAL
jgi:hypothetical protein